MKNIRKSSRRQKYKTNKKIMDKLSAKTRDESITWRYITSGYEQKNDDTRHVFFTSISIHNTKFLIFELSIYESNPEFNFMKIYMQSVKHDYKVDIKEIGYSERLKTLSMDVLKNVMDDLDDDEFREIYDDVMANYLLEN